MENGFERESLVAIVEEILKTGAQDVHEHDIVLTFGGEGVDLTRENITLGSPTTGPKEERYLYILAS